MLTCKHEVKPSTQPSLNHKYVGSLSIVKQLTCFGFTTIFRSNIGGILHGQIYMYVIVLPVSV